jgi:hypothetical protein
VFDLAVNGTSSMSLHLSHVLLTPPLRSSLSELRSADLPLLGSVTLSAASVPYRQNALATTLVQPLVSYRTERADHLDSYTHPPGRHVTGCSLVSCLQQ